MSAKKKGAPAERSQNLRLMQRPQHNPDAETSKLRVAVGPGGSRNGQDHGGGRAARQQSRVDETKNAKKTAGKAKAAKQPAKKSGKKGTSPRKLSALEAAVRVLEESQQAMTCPEMIEVMAKKGYWTSPGGKTPAATLYSSILREINNRGKEARFKKTERGKFARA